MPADLYFGLIVCPANVVEKINSQIDAVLKEAAETPPPAAAPSPSPGAPPAPAESATPASAPQN